LNPRIFNNEFQDKLNEMGYSLYKKGDRNLNPPTFTPVNPIGGKVSLPLWLDL